MPIFGNEVRDMYKRNGEEFLGYATAMRGYLTARTRLFGDQFAHLTFTEKPDILNWLDLQIRELKQNPKNAYFLELAGDADFILDDERHSAYVDAVEAGVEL